MEESVTHQFFLWLKNQLHM